MRWVVLAAAFSALSITGFVSMSVYWNTWLPIITWLIASATLLPALLFPNTDGGNFLIGVCLCSAYAFPVVAVHSMPSTSLLAIYGTLSITPLFFFSLISLMRM